MFSLGRANEGPRRIKRYVKFIGVIPLLLFLHHQLFIEAEVEQ
jgi:hypothetical protein